MNTDEGYITEDGRKIGGVVMEMKNITLRFGGVTAIKDITFDIREGEIRAIIGPNGAVNPLCLMWCQAFMCHRGEVFLEVKNGHRSSHSKLPDKELHGRFKTLHFLRV